MPDVGPIPIALKYGLAAGALYLSNDEHLRLSVLNGAAGVTLALEGRLLDLEGVIDTIRQELIPTTDRVVTRTIAGAREGWLLQGHVRPIAGAPRVGQSYARVEVVRGRSGDVQPIALLAQGYVTETSWLAWPGAGYLGSTEGRGNLRSITGTDPAANTEISETVPTNARWKLISFTAQLVTDATVANREPVLVWDDGASIMGSASPGAVQAASLTRRHSFGPVGVSSSVAAQAQQGGTPVDLLLPGGSRLRTVTANLAAGDNWGAPQILVEEWIED